MSITKDAFPKIGAAQNLPLTYFLQGIRRRTEQQGRAGGKCSLYHLHRRIRRLP